jgi:redox-sensitive bicupin YhaK (pirin superfamily)
MQNNTTRKHLRRQTINTKNDRLQFNFSTSSQVAYEEEDPISPAMLVHLPTTKSRISRCYWFLLVIGILFLVVFYGYSRVYANSNSSNKLKTKPIKKKVEHSFDDVLNKLHMERIDEFRSGPTKDNKKKTRRLDEDDEETEYRSVRNLDDDLVKPVTTVIRRAETRGRGGSNGVTNYYTFSYGEYSDRKQNGIGPMKILNEYITKTKVEISAENKEYEVITYVVDGSAQYKDGAGNMNTLDKKDVLLSSPHQMIEKRENNASGIHLLQIWIDPDNKLLSEPLQTTIFKPKNTDNSIQMIVQPSSGERYKYYHYEQHDGVLSVHHQVFIFTSVTLPNHSTKFILDPKYKAYIYVLTTTNTNEMELTISCMNPRYEKRIILRSGDGIFIEPESIQEVSLDFKHRGDTKDIEFIVILFKQ